MLDEGTGPGTQAIELATRGYTVTATDLAPAAIAYAKRKAEVSGVSIAFAEDDVLATKLTGPFDAIVDRGCFHVLAPKDRAAYAKSTHRLLAPSGSRAPKAQIASRTISYARSSRTPSTSSSSTTPSITASAIRFPRLFSGCFVAVE